MFSEDELYDIFMDYLQTLKDELSSRMDQHIRGYHQENSLITKVNSELLSSNFGGVNLKTWSKQTFSNQNKTEHVVENDIVYEVEYGSNVNGDIHVELSNFLTATTGP